MTEVSNYGKFICNIFSWDTEKIGIIRAKFQIIVWVENDELFKSFFYMCGYSKFVIGEILARIKQLYKKILIALFL